MFGTTLRSRLRRLSVDHGLGYLSVTPTNDLVHWAPSLSAPNQPVLKPCVSAGRKSRVTQDYVTSKASITRDYIAAGAEHLLRLNYYGCNDFVVAGSSTSSVWVSPLLQRLDAYNTELYATHRSLDFDELVGLLSGSGT